MTGSAKPKIAPSRKKNVLYHLRSSVIFHQIQPCLLHPRFQSPPKSLDKRYVYTKGDFSGFITFRVFGRDSQAFVLKSHSDSQPFTHIDKSEELWVMLTLYRIAFSANTKTEAMRYGVNTYPLKTSAQKPYPVWAPNFALAQ